MQPGGVGPAGPPTSLPPAAALGVVAAAILESQRQLGCSRCRYSRGGCRRCRNPDFRPRVSPGGTGQQQQQHVAADPALPVEARTSGAAEARGTKGKRRRKAAAAGQGSGAAPEPLLHTLRRQLQSLHTASGSSAPPPQAAADGDTDSTAAGAAAAGAPAGQLHLKRAAAGTAAASRPAKFFKSSDPQLVGDLEQQQQVVAAAASKRGASSEPSPSSRRPAKRHRCAQGEQQAQPHAAAGHKAAGAAEQAPPLAKRPAAEQQQQQQRPSKFRRVAPPSQPHHQQPHQQQQPPPPHHHHHHHHHHLPAAAAVAKPAGSAGSEEEANGGSTLMDVDLVSPRKRAAAAALERSAGGGGGGSPPSAAFLAKLEENMQLRRQERQASQGGGMHSPLALPAAGKRHKGTAGLAVHSPGAATAAPAAAAAGEQEADPRLCLWEPPVSPFGLLEEELFDDPWKLLVACMLLNKTSGAQVRKVIWQLFALCPTPAAAIAADVQQVQALIQPLGLFRKRAAAIQQLSQDYLYKQWRDPTELYGIGKYAADAYHMFCRGRWREVAPEDKDLRRYRDWLQQTGGLGTGLTRHRTMPA